MSTTRIQLFPGDAIPSFQAKSGRAIGEGVPFRWLEALVQDIQTHIPDQQEQTTCMVFGTEHLRVEYDHTLSPEEALQAQVGDLAERMREVRGLLPRPGETLPPDTAARIAALLAAV